MHGYCTIFLSPGPVLHPSVMLLHILLLTVHEWSCIGFVPSLAIEITTSIYTNPSLCMQHHEGESHLCILSVHHCFVQLVLCIFTCSCHAATHYTYSGWFYSMAYCHSKVYVFIHTVLIIQPQTFYQWSLTEKLSGRTSIWARNRTLSSTIICCVTHNSQQI